MTAGASGREDQIAAELHEHYKAACRRLGWTMRPGVDVSYDELSEDAKELDRVFARWHLARVAAAEARVTATEKQRNNFREDFHAACRERDAAEAERNRLKRIVVLLERDVATNAAEWFRQEQLHYAAKEERDRERQEHTQTIEQWNEWRTRAIKAEAQVAALAEAIETHIPPALLDQFGVLALLRSAPRRVREAPGGAGEESCVCGRHVLHPGVWYIAIEDGSHEYHSRQSCSHSKPVVLPDPAAGATPNQGRAAGGDPREAESQSVETQWEAAERLGLVGVTLYNCDCLNAAPDGSPSDDPEAIYCQRWVVLAEDVVRLTASPPAPESADATLARPEGAAEALERARDLIKRCWHDGVRQRHGICLDCFAAALAPPARPSAEEIK